MASSLQGLVLSRMSASPQGLVLSEKCDSTAQMYMFVVDVRCSGNVESMEQKMI